MSDRRSELADLLSRREQLRKDEETFADKCDVAIQMNHEERDHLAEEKTTFEGGSTRSAKTVRYDLIPPVIDEVLAKRFALGAEKHGPRNWQGGGVEFIQGCINHLEDHKRSLIENGPFHSDDDIGAMLWNVGVLAWFRRNKPAEMAEALKQLR